MTFFVLGIPDCAKLPPLTGTGKLGAGAHRSDMVAAFATTQFESVLQLNAPWMNCRRVMPSYYFVPVQSPLTGVTSKLKKEDFPMAHHTSRAENLSARPSGRVEHRKTKRGDRPE
jgi:hypothetical protein